MSKSNPAIQQSRSPAGSLIRRSLLRWLLSPLVLLLSTVLFSCVILLIRHGDLNSLHAFLIQQDFQYLPYRASEMEKGETSLSEVESAGYQLIKLELRNLTTAKTQLQGITSSSANCNCVLLDPLPISIGPFGVKSIRILASKTPGVEQNFFKMTRDGSSEFVSVSNLEKR